MAELKNQRIAEANPNVKANREFVDALFREAHDRKATDKEWEILSAKYPLVKDISNIVLGKDRSPFFQGATAPKAKKEERIYNVSEEMKKNPSWEGMPDNMKAMAEMYYTTMTTKNENTRQQMASMIEEAKKTVDPATRFIFASQEQTIPETFKIKKLSVENQLTSAAAKLQEVDEFLQELPIEEQQALGQIKREYIQNVENLQDKMADRGLSYSTKRTDLERFIGEQNIDLMQSTERGYARRERQLARTRKEIERQQDLIKQAGEAQLKQMARGAEEMLGTERFGGLGLEMPGQLGGGKIKPIGGKGVKGMPGEIERSRQAEIYKLAQIFGEYKSPTELKSLY